jgi:hypothetical protein
VEPGSTQPKPDGGPEVAKQVITSGKRERARKSKFDVLAKFDSSLQKRDPAREPGAEGAAVDAAARPVSNMAAAEVAALPVRARSDERVTALDRISRPIFGAEGRGVDVWRPELPSETPTTSHRTQPEAGVSEEGVRPARPRLTEREALETFVNERRSNSGLWNTASVPSRPWQPATPMAMTPRAVVAGIASAAVEAVGRRNVARVFEDTRRSKALKGATVYAASEAAAQEALRSELDDHDMASQHTAYNWLVLSSRPEVRGDSADAIADGFLGGGRNIYLGQATTNSKIDLIVVRADHEDTTWSALQDLERALKEGRTSEATVLAERGHIPYPDNLGLAVLREYNVGPHKYVAYKRQVKHAPSPAPRAGRRAPRAAT